LNPSTHKKLYLQTKTYRIEQNLIIFALWRRGFCSDWKDQHLCALFSGGLSNILINLPVNSFFFLCVLDKFKDLITQISKIFNNMRELSVKSPPCLHPVFVFGPSFNPSLSPLFSEIHKVRKFY
jgi:hypothetical protein